MLLGLKFFLVQAKLKIPVTMKQFGFEMGGIGSIGYSLCLNVTFGTKN